MTDRQFSFAEKRGKLKTDQSRHKQKTKIKWQIFIANVAEASIPASQV